MSKVYDRILRQLSNHTPMNGHAYLNKLNVIAVNKINKELTRTICIPQNLVKLYTGRAL